MKSIIILILILILGLTFGYFDGPRNKSTHDNVSIDVLETTTGTVSIMQRDNKSVKLDKNLPLQKASLFWHWKWPFMAPVGPTLSNFPSACSCPLMQQNARRVLIVSY
jgi:hypothetical protein